MSAGTAHARRRLGCTAPGPMPARSDSNIIKEICMKKLAAVLTLLAIGAIYGCNTFEGMGKDVERGGEKVQDSAKDTKQKM
jgi:entericidin B